MKKISLTKQLIYIIILIVGIIFIALGIILPKELLPIYEENIYNKLKEPLYFINKTDDIYNDRNNADIAYVYIIQNKVYISNNINSVIDNYNDIILNYINYDKGKFIYKNKIYYYYKRPMENNRYIISLTNDNYINKMKKDILYTILIVTGLSFTLSSLLLILWSNNLVSSIIILKKKIKNLDNYDYNIKLNHTFDDEIASLNESIESMKSYLKNNELYKNQTYQSISHDFKTPIAVIKSYIEAYEDGVKTPEDCIDVIKEQTNNLENKVHSLLYLNKLNYLKDTSDGINKKTNIKEVINNSVDKFRMIRPDIEYKLEFDNKTLFRGTNDMWEAIIDNLLNNFMRYTKKAIKITVKNKRIILYNDGEQIDTNLLDNIFTPYKKGINGMFGFGLSIVKKTLQVLNYDISVNNVKNGVNFIIK